MTPLLDLNLHILYSLLTLTSEYVWFATAAIFFGHYLLFFIIALSVYIIYKDFKNSSQAHFLTNQISLITTLAAAFAVTETIRNFFPYLRPYAKLGVQNLLTVTTSSFPSGHTTFIFSLATAMYFYNKKFAIFLYGCGILVGLARIAAGVHYPLDILGGAILGVAVGSIASMAVRKLRN